MEDLSSANKTVVFFALDECLTLLVELKKEPHTRMPQSGGPKSVSIIARKIFVDPIHDVINFFKEYSKIFGSLFIILISLTYFFQGFRQYTAQDGAQWYYKQLGLSSSTITGLSATILLPFNLKFIWGLIFDNIPLFKRNYQPWYFISATIGVGAFLVLGLPNLKLNETSTTAVLFLAILSQAMTDVVADGMVVKNARMAGARGGAGLQTLCWIMFSAGQIVSAPAVSSITGEEGEGSQNLMLWLFMPCSVVLMGVSFFMKEAQTDKKLTPMNIVKTIWRLIKGVLFNTKVLLPITWIFLRSALVPTISAPWSFWLGQEVDIGANDQALISALTGVISILALFAFARWFTATPFRKIFFWTQLVVACLGFLDYSLYKGWNLKIGIPNVAFYIISQSLFSVIDQLASMPFLVMAAQLCPQSIEAAFYATMTSLSNAGSAASKTWSKPMLQALGVDTVDATGKKIIDVVQLEKALLINIGLTFAPILFLWMVPNVSAINAHDDEDEMTTAERDALEEAAAEGDDMAAVELKKQDEKVDAAAHQ
ncbi:hypothetical protein HDV05_003329 [Chytridiales sp. JEL 0842]|nr:hypothetical protein HDV05_003329 [Chytridiales sp. JEL 0842]